jgi:cyclic-di-GMP phosphodiesterase TipF (flagellum assembly factor)
VSALRHILLLLCYALPAAALGIYLPQWLPLIDRGAAIGAGVTVLLAGGLAHEVRARLARDVRLSDQMVELRRAVFHLQEELSWSRREAKGLGEALEAVARSGRAGRDGRAVEEVMAEVKALKALVERVSDDADRRAREPAQEQETEQQGAIAMAGGGRAVAQVAAKPAARPRAAPLMLVPLPSEVDEAALLDAVSAALRDDRIDLALQPVVSLPQRKTCFYECFSRLRSEDGTTLLPEQYIAIAEREGYMTAIDNMLLLRCTQLVRKVQKKKSKIGFFCNVSPHTLRDEDFFADFVDFLERNEELAPNLIFEFAQGDLADYERAENRQLDRLAMLGCRFSVDQVRELDLDPAALARRRVRFVRVEVGVLLAAAAEDEAAPNRLKNRLAREGIDLIAEKVEDEATLAELLDHRIDFGQGFLFGEPRPARPPG